MSVTERRDTARRTSRAARTAVALLVVPLVLMSGCAGGDRPRYEPAVGTNARVAGMDALRVAIVTNDTGVGTLVGTLLNTTDTTNALISAHAVTDRAAIGIVMPRGDLELPPDDPVQLAPKSAVSLTSAKLTPGLYVEIELQFRHGPSMQLFAPVEPQEGPYAEIEVTVPPDGDVSPTSVDN